MTLENIKYDDYQTVSMFNYITYLIDSGEDWDLDDYDSVGNIEVELKPGNQLEVEGGELSFVITVDENSKIVLSEVRERVSRSMFIEFNGSDITYK